MDHIIMNTCVDSVLREMITSAQNINTKTVLFSMTKI